MTREQKELLKKLQAVEFALVELNLFLDTHPDNEEALRDFNCFAKELHMLKREYESSYGPLINFGFSPSRYPWRWIDEPWPWEVNM